jgi:hypothetical protein
MPPLADSTNAPMSAAEEHAFQVGAGPGSHLP